MSLPAGTALGVYEILSTIGAGGMGERFRHEAQLLASLNHPNIGAMYGLDEAASIQFLIFNLFDELRRMTAASRQRP